MTLKQIGGKLNFDKFSGVYSLEDQIELQKSLGQANNYTFTKSTSKFWPAVETAEESLIFSTDGTKAFVCGSVNDRLYAYTAVQPYSLDELSLIGPQVATTTNSPGSFTFGNSGNKLYTSTSTNVYQYACTTPYDATSVNFNSPEVTYATQASTSGVGLKFSNDGTKMFTANGGSYIDTYTLSVGWSLSSTVTYQSNSRFGHPTNINDFWINSAGTKLVVADSSLNLVKYNLSTAWDLTTAALDNTDLYDLSVSSASAAKSCVYGDSGNKMYVLRDNGDVTQLNLGTAYRGGKEVSSYTHKTAPTISGGPTANFSAITFQAGGTDVGKKYWAVNTGTDIMYEYILSAAWDITTATYNNKSFDIGTRLLANPSFVNIQIETTCTGVTFNSTGTKIYFMGDSGDTISEATLTTAWDINTIKFPVEQSKVSIITDLVMQDVTFGDSGTKFYTIGSGGATKQVYQYNLGTAWDVTTSASGSTADKTFNINTGTSRDTDPRSVRFSSAGTTMFVLGNQNNKVYQYTLSTAWDVSTAAYSKEFTIGTTEIALADVPSGLAFNADGTKMFILGDEVTNAVYQYTLTTAWDLGTVTLNAPTTGYTISFDATPTGIVFGDSGNKMYVVGNTSDTIRQFNLSVAYDINSTVTLQGASISLNDGDVTGIDFSSDGKIIYVCGNTGDKVYAYTLPTAWDLSSFAHNRIGLTAATYNSIAFVDNDDKFYYISGTNTVVRRDLTTPGVITGAQTVTTAVPSTFGNTLTGLAVAGNGSYLASVSSSWLYVYAMPTTYDITTIKNDRITTGAAIESVAMKDDGSKLFYTNTSARLYQRSLDTNFDFNTGVGGESSIITISVDGVTRPLLNIEFSSNGLNLWGLISTTFQLAKYELLTAWDVTTLFQGSYLFPYVDHSCIRFNSAGTHLYGMTGTAMYQYDLSTAFDIRTISYTAGTTKTLRIDATPVSFEISEDESKIYILGDETNTIYEYVMSTPGNLSTASYLDFVNVSTQGLDPKSTALSLDGTKMYALIGTTIYQYTLSTPWQLTTATYASKSFSVSSFSSDPKSIKIFGTDGKSMSVLDGTGAKITQFYMSTAWDISTAWFEKTLNVSARDTVPSSIYVGPPQTISGVTAGTRLYIGGADNGTNADEVYQYTLSTPWDITTATYNSTYNTQASLIYGLFFNPEGTRMYLTDDGNNAFRQYTLSTPWDLSTAYRYRTVSVSGQDSVPTDIVFCKYGADAGKILYVLGDSSDTIYQYHLGTAYDLNTLNTSASIETVGGIANVPARKSSPSLNTLSNSTGGATAWTSLDFNDTGTRVYLADDTNNRIVQFNLDTAWDITTLRGLARKVLASANNNAYGITWGKDGATGTMGKRLYVGDEVADVVYQYDLETAYSVATINISTSTVNGVAGYKTFATSTYEAAALAVEINNDGTKMFIIGYSSDRIVEFILDTPWDITSARLPYRLKSLSAQTTNATGLTFKTDGTKMYVLNDGASDIIYQYSLSTAWNVNTATYESKSFTLQTEGSHTGFDITDVYDAGGGNWKQHLYAVGTGNDRIYRYTITATTSTDAKFWDISQFGTVEATSLLVTPVVGSTEGNQQSIKISKDGANAGKYLTLVGSTNDDVYFYSMSTAYDLSTATLMTGTKDVSTAELAPTGVAVAYGSGVTEGTVFYVVGAGSDTILEYSLKQSGVLTPWASGTITWTLERSQPIGSLYVPSILNATDLAVSKNGEWIYVLDAQNVWGFPMSTAHNLRTANIGDLYVGTQESIPTAMRFANNGLELYVYGQSGDDINRYTLSTAWQVRTATFTSNSAILADSSPLGLEVANDGSKFWVCGTTDIIREYTPSANYNTTLTAGTTKEIGYAILDPRSLKFNNDGTKLFVTSATAIWELDVDSPYVTNAINTQFFASPDSNPMALRFKTNNVVGGANNGTKFAVYGSLGDTLKTFTCGYAWNVSSVTSTFTSGGLYEINITGMCFSPDGTKTYLTGQSTDKITQHTSVDYELQNTTIVNQTVLSPIGFFANPEAIEINTTGTKMFSLVGTTIYEFVLDSAYNADSIYSNEVLVVNDTNPRGLHIGDNGTKLTFQGTLNDRLYIYSLPYAWNANNFTLFNNTATNIPDSNGSGIWVSDDGKTVLWMGITNDKIFRLSSSTAWGSSWSAAGTDKVYNLAHRLNPDALCFSSDGLIMYFISETTVVQIQLETPWHPDSAYSGVLLVNGQDSAPVSLCKTSDGLNLYMLGDTGNDINRYTLGTAHKITTGSFNTVVSHGTGDNLVTGIECNSTASIFWLTGPTDRIYQVANNGASGALGTFTQSTNLDLTRVDTAPIDLFLGDSGNYLYFTGQENDGVYRLTLLTPNSIVGYEERKLSISSQTTSPLAITRNSSCDKLFVIDVNLLLQYDLPAVNGEIRLGSYSGKYLYIAPSTGGATTATDMHLTRNNKYIYIPDTTSDTVKNYSARFK
jgi:hypothetical protein